MTLDLFFTIVRPEVLGILILSSAIGGFIQFMNTGKMSKTNLVIYYLLSAACVFSLLYEVLSYGLSGLNLFFMVGFILFFSIAESARNHSSSEKNV